MCTNRSPWRDLNAYTRVAVARVPPIVPDAGLNHGRLALMKNADLPIAFDGQLTLDHRESLDKTGMVVFPDHTCPDERGQLGSRTAPRGCPTDAPGSWRVPW
jgi:hypothetical protein